MKNNICIKTLTCLFYATNHFSHETTYSVLVIKAQSYDTNHKVIVAAEIDRGRKTDIWSSYKDAGVGVTYKTNPKPKVVAPAKILQRSSQESREQKSSNGFSEKDLIGLTWILGALIVYIEGCRTGGLLAMRLHDFEIVGSLDIPNWTR